MVARPKLNSIPLGQAVDDFVGELSRAVEAGSSRPTQATLVTYSRNLHDLVRILGEDVLTDDITGDDLSKAIARYSKLADRRRSEHRDNPLAPTTAAGERKSEWSRATFWRSVRRFFSHAEVRGWVQASPVDYVGSQPSVNSRTPKAPEREALDLVEFQALLRWGPGEEPPAGQAGKQAQKDRYLWLRNRALLTLMAVTGPRVSELCNADRADFTGFSSGQVWWRIIGKGNHERRIPISEDVKQLLIEAWDAAPEPRDGATRAAFLTVRGNRIDPRDVQNLMRVAYARVKGSEDRLAARAVTPHGLRHTAATLLAAAGWDIRLIAKMLGHANLATLAVYLDARDHELIAMMIDHPATRGTNGKRDAGVNPQRVDEMKVIPSPEAHPNQVAS